MTTSTSRDPMRRGWTARARLLETLQTERTLVTAKRALTGTSLYLFIGVTYILAHHGYGGGWRIRHTWRASPATARCSPTTTDREGALEGAQLISADDQIQILIAVIQLFCAPVCQHNTLAYARAPAAEEGGCPR